MDTIERVSTEATIVQLIFIIHRFCVCIKETSNNFMKGYA